MANFHSRSKSLPSEPHPLMDDVQNHLCRLKSSETASTSSDSLCSNLACLKDLHEGINDLIQLPSVQQALSHEGSKSWISEMLEASLGLVDLCEFSRDVIYSTKESVRELESAIRRNRGEKTATSDEFDAYVASRKKIVKKVNKYIKNLKSFIHKDIILQDENDELKAIATTLKETEALDFLVLKSVLSLLSGEKASSKQRKWSLLSKFSHSTRVHSQEDGSEELCFLNIHKSTKDLDNFDMLKRLQSSEMIIQEIEEELEALFKSLVKTRVSLLNVLSH